MIYLASSSPRRRKILKGLGIRFKILIPDYHEKPLAGAGPSKLVLSHALGKALSAAPAVRSGRILSADSIVYFQKKIIGKPKNKKDAFRILNSLQGQWQMVYTGVAVLDVERGKIKKRCIFIEKTRLKLHPMSRRQIKKYFRRVNPLDKAGACSIQEGRGSLLAQIRGSFLNAVGLPVESLRRKKLL